MSQGRDLSCKVGTCDQGTQGRIQVSYPHDTDREKKPRNEGFFALLTSYDRNTPCVGAGGGTSEPKLTNKHGKRLQCHRHQVICSDKNDAPD